MLYEIFLAIIQAATEFLPVSSSGHLSLLANLFAQPNLFLFTVLHLASLGAILIFTRKEIKKLILFKKGYRILWLYLIIGTIPATLLYFLLKETIEQSFSSYLYLGLAFIFTGLVLFSTKFFRGNKKLTWKSSLIIGISQAIALFPGVSRSGMTLSSSLFCKINKDEAVKFSFLLLIPLVLGAIILESGMFCFSWALVVSFLICLLLSFFFLKILYKIILLDKLWIFSIYCFLVGLISLIIHFYG